MSVSDCEYLMSDFSSVPQCVAVRDGAVDDAEFRVPFFEIDLRDVHRSCSCCPTD